MPEKKKKTFTSRDARNCIIVPSDLDHKYSRGVLGVITGSAQYPGAAVLTTAAASATGLGMIRFHSSSGLAHLVLHTCPEVVVQPGPVTAWLAGSGIHEKKRSDFTTWLRHRWFTLLKAQTVPAVLDAGAEEVNDLGESFEVVCEASELVAVRTALQTAGIDYESADSSFLPSMTIPLDAEGATKVFELIDAIEELDDVQNVFSNFDVSDEVMASLA